MCTTSKRFRLEHKLLVQNLQGNILRVKMGNRKMVTYISNAYLIQRSYEFEISVWEYWHIYENFISFDYANPACAPIIRHFNLLDSTLKNRFVVLSLTKNWKCEYLYIQMYLCWTSYTSELVLDEKKLNCKSWIYASPHLLQNVKANIFYQKKKKKKRKTQKEKTQAEFDPKHSQVFIHWPSCKPVGPVCLYSG